MLFTHITSALITYDKSTLLDIGNRFTNLVQDTLSPNPSWPLEILRNAENKGHGRRNKKHRGKSAGIRNRLRKRAHSPPLPSILLANVQSLENKMDDLRARISFQRDIRDCNIMCPGQFPSTGPCQSWPSNNPHPLDWLYLSLSSPPVAGVWWAHWRRCPVAAVASSKWMLHTGGGWGETPHMIVKRFGCMAIHNKSAI